MASFSLSQLKKYKEYAYKWDYIDCSQFNGLKSQDYDSIFISSSIKNRNRKNKHKDADMIMEAIKLLNAEGKNNPSMKEISIKISEMQGD